MDFLEAVQKRRSMYSLTKESPITEERIGELLKEAVKNLPSSFNMQSSRAVLLLRENHTRLWEIVMQTLKGVVPEDAFARTEKKIQSFSAAYGTILFYEDMDVVEEFSKKFELYRDKFHIWAQQTNGMLQYAVWTLLEAEGLGASLQHYNPLIDTQVKTEWNIPDGWSLIAQMPFGAPSALPKEKQFRKIEERVLIFP